jgi:hypothetical protein
MPETPMHEDNFPETAEDDIGSPRKIRHMKPVSIPKREDQLPNDQFGPSIRGANARHDFGSFGR